MEVSYLSKMVVRRRENITQHSIPRSKKGQNRVSSPSLDQWNPSTASGALPSGANALAPFPTHKYFLALTQAQKETLPSSYLSCFSNQAPRRGPGRSRSPCGTMDAAFAHQDPQNSFFRQMVVIFYQFLEPCGLAHSRHPGAQHLKARVKAPHLLG